MDIYNIESFIEFGIDISKCSEYVLIDLNIIISNIYLSMLIFSSEAFSHLDLFSTAQMIHRIGNRIREIQGIKTAKMTIQRRFKYDKE